MQTVFLSVDFFPFFAQVHDGDDRADQEQERNEEQPPKIGEEEICILLELGIPRGAFLRGQGESELALGKSLLRIGISPLSLLELQTSRREEIGRLNGELEAPEFRPCGGGREKVGVGIDRRSVTDVDVGIGAR